jgi:hypothetical protein
MRTEVVKTAASGHGHLVLIHVDQSQQDEWRRRAYEGARQRLIQAEMPEGLLAEARQGLQAE